MSAAHKLPWSVEPGLYADGASYAFALAIVSLALTSAVWRDGLPLGWAFFAGSLTYLWIALERRDLLRAAELASPRGADNRREACAQKDQADDAE